MKADDIVLGRSVRSQIRYCNHLLDREKIKYITEADFWRISREVQWKVEEKVWDEVLELVAMELDSDATLRFD